MTMLTATLSILLATTSPAALADESIPARTVQAAASTADSTSGTSPAPTTTGPETMTDDNSTLKATGGSTPGADNGKSASASMEEGGFIARLKRFFGGSNGDGGSSAVGQASGDAAEVEKKLDGQESLQGTWDFGQPRDPKGLPDALKYKSLSMTIQGKDYVMVKDGQEVARGTLGETGYHYLTDARTGELYAFESMWLTGVSGKTMAAMYKVDGDSRFVDMAKRPEASDVELRRFLKAGTLKEVDIVRTDKANVPVFQFHYDGGLSRSCYVHRGQLSYGLEGADKAALVGDILKVLESYSTKGLEKLSQKTELPPEQGKGSMDGTDADCLAMYFKNADGLVHSLYFRGDVPQVAEQVARELDALFHKYESKRAWKAEAPMDVVGTWTSGKGVPFGGTYVFNADGTYSCTAGRGGVPSKGRYVVVGNYVMSDDLVGRWSKVVYTSRRQPLGAFENLSMRRGEEGVLSGIVPIMDAPTTTYVKFTRQAEK